MKKVLIITNLDYASPRIPALVKYLPKYGWSPVVLEMSRGEPKVVQAAREKRKTGHIRSMLAWLYRRYKSLRYYPDSFIGQRAMAIEEGRKIMRDTKIDAILTSSAPETSHLVACELTKEFHTPWLADFRDLWVLNHNYPYNRIRKMFEKRLEIRTMRLADALVTVSKPLSEKQASLHQCEKLDTEGSDVKVRKKVFTIPNGFDPELIPRDVHLTKNLTITYTGQFYEKQHPERLFFALCDMMRSVILSKQLEIRIYGRFDERVERLVERSGIRKLYGEDVVRQYGKVSREEALKKQKESQILWLTQFEDEKESGMLGTKIFEYLGASRPILFTGSFVDSVVKDLLDETNAGFYCSNEREIKNALQGFYVEYESKGAVSYKGNMSKINEYSHLEMARKFAEALDSVVGKRK